MGMLQPREEELENEVELLRQKLAALTGSTQEEGVLLGLGHGITLRLATILALMVKRSPAPVSRTTFHQMMYGDRSDGGPEPKIFAVHISRLRSLLKRVGAPGKIVTVWNAGYYPDPKLTCWVKDLYKNQIPQEK